MARIVRIDKITVTGNDVNVEYTAGPAPLPIAPSGLGFSFNRGQLAEKIAELEATSDQTLVLMRLASHLRADPALARPGDSTGRTATMDLTGANAVFVLS